MKVLYKANDKMQFEVEGGGQKELFKEIAQIQEIFGEDKCGMCKKDNIKLSVRTIEDNDYFELKWAEHFSRKEKTKTITICPITVGINGKTNLDHHLSIGHLSF
jgi:hypothetical protein